MERYAIVVSIASPDTKQQHKLLLDTLEGRISGQECTGQGPDFVCDHYTLTGDPDKQIVIVLAINGDVANNLQNDLERSLHRAYIHLWFPVPRTRQELRRVGLRSAFFNANCVGYAHFSAGDTVPATLTFTSLATDPAITG